MTEDVTLTIADAVAKIVLNRPRQLNAVTPEMAATLEELCAQVDRDDAVRAVLIAGAGEPVEAEEAHRLGLVDILVEDAEVETRATALCRQLAGYSPVAVQSVKAAVRMALAAPLDAGLRYENEMNALCFAAGDHLEGIKAFQERRPAQFER